MTPQSRQALRARAHRLHPVVSISQKGLTENVLAEIEAALRAHELIKIRIYGAERDERAALLEEICAQSRAEPVQQIGNILIIYRERPQPVSKPAASRARPTPRKGSRKPPIDPEDRWYRTRRRKPKPRF